MPVPFKVVKALLKNDLITKEDDSYQVYNYFFADWLAKKMSHSKYLTRFNV